MSGCDVVVVGAGISGLAAAYELTRRGARVVVVERGTPFGEQSAGLGRIFRIAHRRAALCALALEAREGWTRWERELGAGRLLGDEGFVAAGPHAQREIAAAMASAGAAYELLDGAGIAAAVGLLSVPPPWDAGLLDPAGGSLRIRRALTALAARVEVRRAECVAVDPDGSVRLAGGAVLRARAVLVCAGTATPALAATAGLRLVLHVSDHVRLTYAMRGAVSPACLAAPEGYGLPLGSTGRWAFGMEGASADQAAFVAATFGGVEPEPVAEVRCVSLQAPWLDAGGDGWTAVRNGRVIAFTGANLMKFGPLLGDRLARSALGEGVHPDLIAPLRLAPAPRATS